jgi:myo-inositol 2-dehydrogenase/D-chiro-inositol 1-dehydrogenase
MSMKSSRRLLLRSAGAGAAGIGLCQIVPSRVLGGPGRTPPSETLRFAVIGLGGLGSSIAGNCCQANRQRRLIAVCDCDPKQLDRRRKELAPIVRDRQGHELACYLDFRELLERTDIDVVHVGTPPHWHVLISILAMQMGMDVMCEKPMIRFIAEGRAIVEAARQYGRICLVDSGCFHDHSREAAVARKLVEPPPEANPAYDMWCGPSPYNPWRGIVHGGFRQLWDHDGGAQADFGPHWIPTVVEILGKFGEDPVEIEGESQYPPDPEFAHGWYRSTLRYADGTKLILESSLGRENEPLPAIEVSGPKGKIAVMQKGNTSEFHAEPADLLEEAKKLPDEPRRINSDEVFRTRKDEKRAMHPDAETQFSAEKTLHLSNISFRVGRKLVWDPAKQTIVGDEQARSMLNIPVRAPWRLY